ncbi:hypothetical protein BDN67DRAFT_973654, partial [Paxillus ammoniavirescens]
ITCGSLRGQLERDGDERNQDGAPRMKREKKGCWGAATRTRPCNGPRDGVPRLMGLGT